MRADWTPIVAKRPGGGVWPGRAPGYCPSSAPRSFPRHWSWAACAEGLEVYPKIRGCHRKPTGSGHPWDLVGQGGRHPVDQVALRQQLALQGGPSPKPITSTCTFPESTSRMTRSACSGSAILVPLTFMSVLLLEIVAHVLDAAGGEIGHQLAFLPGLADELLQSKPAGAAGCLGPPLGGGLLAPPAISANRQRHTALSFSWRSLLLQMEFNLFHACP